MRHSLNRSFDHLYEALGVSFNISSGERMDDPKRRLAQ